jgi:ferredoxin
MCLVVKIGLGSQKPKNKYFKNLKKIGGQLGGRALKSSRSPATNLLPPLTFPHFFFFFFFFNYLQIILCSVPCLEICPSDAISLSRDSIQL